MTLNEPMRLPASEKNIDVKAQNKAVANAAISPGYGIGEYIQFYQANKPNRIRLPLEELNDDFLCNNCPNVVFPHFPALK